jgi:hypothetical protein
MRRAKNPAQPRETLRETQRFDGITMLYLQACLPTAVASPSSSVELVR